MKLSLLAILRCPNSGSALRLEGGHPLGEMLPLDSSEEIESGWLVSEDGHHRYPIRRGIPRFVPASNYADNFGMQWNHFAKTQLDSHSGAPISAERFWKATGWNPADLKGRWVLDAGCGAGRFAEIAVAADAQVVALDFSSAVDACRENLARHPNLHVVQGDLYALPLARGSFEFIYSLGVLQHTPNVAKAFSALPPILCDGGRLCVDYYQKSFRSSLLPKYWLRPVTRRMDRQRLFRLLQASVPSLLRASRAIGRIPGVGGMLKRMVPVADYQGILPLSDAQLSEWALLDTFDWLSPAYDQPQTPRTARYWFEQAGMQQVEILTVGHLVGRGRKV
jgi:SAM-dependent methyltransferase